MAAATPMFGETASGPKILIVVAHPDDEYAFATTVYRITKELGGTVDQVVITNGEAGYRYSRLAEAYYGLALTHEEIGRSQLPAIRKEETLRAGRILGIRHHWFLEQKDARFTLDGKEAFSGIWNVSTIRNRIAELCRDERYDFVFGLLPTSSTHGHHQAATLIALEAVAQLPLDFRPVVLGSEPSAGPTYEAFHGRGDVSAFRLVPGGKVYSVSRNEAFGPGDSLNYSIVVNWVIAEHKSQGLFQTECGKHSQENFWLFDTDTAGALQKTKALFDSFHARKLTTAR